MVATYVAEIVLAEKKKN